MCVCVCVYSTIESPSVCVVATQITAGSGHYFRCCRWNHVAHLSRLLHLSRLSVTPETASRYDSCVPIFLFKCYRCVRYTVYIDYRC